MWELREFNAKLIQINCCFTLQNDIFNEHLKVYIDITLKVNEFMTYIYKWIKHVLLLNLAQMIAS